MDHKISTNLKGTACLQVGFLNVCKHCLRLGKC
jgi:hypothetical protein